MKSIIYKELNSYFSGLGGYLAIGLFVMVASLTLFVFGNDLNILDYGYVDLTPFFILTPYLLIFLIPAVTMRSFSLERDLGTLELLMTRPLSTWQIIFGKYVAALLITIIALTLTLVYPMVLSMMGDLDLGPVIGSYTGLVLVAMGFTAIGLFTSLITTNQIISFLSAAILCFFIYYGLESLAATSSSVSWIRMAGMSYHFDSLARGVLDTRNLIYLLGVAVFFLALSESVLKSNTTNN
ncbi:MAG: ABC transporter permease [Nonlabens sp.]